MARPTQQRRVCQAPGASLFRPAGIGATERGEVIITVDEYEALRLADLEGLYHEPAARRMGVSRRTFGRIIQSGRRKVARALTDGLALRIDGGKIEITGTETIGVGRMNVAVASDDGVTISQHSGHSRCFIVFSIERGEVRDETVRQNTVTAHTKGECHGGQHDDAHAHRHADVLMALRGCQAVLCSGMGWRAAEELGKHGIKCFLVEDPATPREAVEQYIAGTLRSGDEFCRCHE